MHCKRKLLLLLIPWHLLANQSFGNENLRGMELFESYCFDCHDEDVQKGNVNMAELFDAGSFDGSLMFENLITAKMPPENKKQPNAEEKRAMLDWLAKRQADHKPAPYRRISRHEFVHSLNDLLGIKLDLTGEIPDDRGTFDFDSDRRIKLTKEMLGSYFKVADRMLEFALPTEGYARSGFG